jgi:glycosyltransferase involved in cell wall biosynthesis
MACGRPVLISDRVGCGLDVVNPSCGAVFTGRDPAALAHALVETTTDAENLKRMGRAAARRAWSFDIGLTESSLVEAVERVRAL